MKYLLIICLALVGCIPPAEQARHPREGYLQTVVIDGCEYLEYSRYPNSNAAVYSLTHKGDCHNPIHQKP